MATKHFLKPWLPKNDAPSYLFSNANIVDPVKGEIIENSSVYVAGGKILNVGVAGSTLEVPEGVQQVDLEGKYLCPGLIDCHVHIAAIPGDLDLRLQLATPRDQVMFRMAFVCRDMLRRGFTTARDCGGAPLALKEACEEWIIPGPRLFICGHGMSQTGGHGDFRSGHEHTDNCAGSLVAGLARVCDGVPECLRAARDEIRRGADFIKVMAGGGVASPTDRLEDLQYTPEEFRAFVSVASNAGTYVTCHAYIPRAIEIAITNGVKGIEHGNLIDKKTARLMADKGAFLTPTLIAYKAMSDKAVVGLLPPSAAEKNIKVLEAGMSSLKLAKEEGVTLCYGSDLLGPLGTYQSLEFELRAEVLSAVEILQSATINPARMMGLTDSGEIKKGYRADLIVLKSNPLDDIRVLSRSETEILAVFKQGRVCRSELPGLTGLLDEYAKL